MRYLSFEYWAIKCRVVVVCKLCVEPLPGLILSYFYVHLHGQPWPIVCCLPPARLVGLLTEPTIALFIIRPLEDRRVAMVTAALSLSFFLSRTHNTLMTSRNPVAGPTAAPLLNGTEKPDGSSKKLWEKKHPHLSSE
jgi:hypothetical protein